jgi:ABC-type uncharacterized transport system substrate-binding protein
MTNTIGIVHSGTKGRHDKNINHLKSKLDGQVNLDEKNIYWAEDDLQKLGTYAAKLVTDSMDLIVAAGGSASANAVKGATEKRPDIKVVCTSVSSSVILAPNMAGICVLSSDLDAVRLELLHEYMEGTMPGETKFGALFNSSRPKSSIQLAALNAAAHAIGINLDPQDVYTPKPNPEPKIKSAFQGWQQQKIKAAIVTADPIFNNHLDKVTAAANDKGKGAPIAAIYQWREFAETNGLMSYGPSLQGAYGDCPGRC